MSLSESPSLISNNIVQTEHQCDTMLTISGFDMVFGRCRVSLQNLSKVPIPLQQLLVGAGFRDGSTWHHQDMVHVGQPMQPMGHQDASLNGIYNV